MENHAEHIREIETVGLGASSRRDPTVVRSWLRCIEQHRLDPAKACEAYIVPDATLREHRQRSEDLIEIARSGLERLFRQIAGQNYVLLLANSRGVTVEFLGDPLFDNNLRKAGLYIGSEWSESRAGTCAVGACIEAGEALTIHQTDHFDNTHTPLSCTAAPIYDARGELAAVLDISLLSSPIRKVSQNLALHMVRATARRIELANLMAETRHEWVLRFAQLPEFLDVDPEAAVSIDGGGKILGMTHGGARILGHAAGIDWRVPTGLIGQPLSRFFELEIDDLPNLTRQRPTQDRLVRGRDGNALFAHAIEPRRIPRGRVAGAAVPASLRLLGGPDPAIAALKARAAKLAVTALPILIRGETGVGKEFLARALHECGRRAGAFVAVNCAAIPEALIESELFGHVPGAFTGAAPRGRKGLIAEADGGSLFLDEIGDMPLALQSRLLRVLAEGEVQPIGAARPRPVNLRVISASHRDLGAMARDGTFRADLYYRLNAAPLDLPPLRARGDFDWLLERVLARHRRPEGALRVAAEALRALGAHDWPGNIRELDNVVAVAVALCDGDVIGLDDLPEELTRQRAALPVSGQVPVSGPEGGPERAELAGMLEECGWNVSEAARRLGLDRSTVHRRMKRLGLRARE